MDIANRIREVREAKKLTQGDIEKRSGLLRCYISRVEGGRTVPSIPNLEKIARALEISLYQLFYDGDQRTPPPPPVCNEGEISEIGWWSPGQNARLWAKLQNALSRMEEDERQKIFYIAAKLAARSIKRKAPQQHKVFSVHRKFGRAV